MPRIEFLRDHVVRDENEGTDDEIKYKKGQLIECSDGTANHWINRGTAELAKPKRGRPSADEKADNQESKSTK